MEFKQLEQKDFDYERSLNEWRAGRWTIAELPFAFGQHRIQVWFHGSGAHPDVVGLNF